MIASRNIEDLLPQLQAKARGMVAEVRDMLGIELRITSTYRDFDEQDRLYSIGRGADAGKRPTVTKAKGGESWHNWRRAFDVVPVRNGICIWGDAALWEKIGALGIKYGLEWGGSWRRFPDRPHFQLTEGLRIADLLAKHPKGIA